MIRNVQIPRTAFPLAWPPHVERTRPHRRQPSDFSKRRSHSRTSTPVPGQAPVISSWTTKDRVSIGEARDELLAELSRLGAVQPLVISSNLPVRLDGLPYANAATPADPGVAVYFVLRKVETCVAIDRWDRVADNLRAITKSIEAMRGIERWGGARLVEAAFTGFQGLPAPGETSGVAWWETLGVPREAPLGEIETVARELSAAAHPDAGGSVERFQVVRAALAAARMDKGAVPVVA